jgi:hypothetical protein
MGPVASLSLSLLLQKKCTRVHSSALPFLYNRARAHTRHRDREKESFRDHRDRVFRGLSLADFCVALLDGTRGRSEVS